MKPSLLIWPTLLLLIFSCTEFKPKAEDSLVARGRKLFDKERFDGNGRKCSTCHHENNNFTLDTSYLIHYRRQNPLFIAGRDSTLAELDMPRLLREYALVGVRNTTGNGAANRTVVHSVPHLFGVAMAARDSVPRFGWDGKTMPLRDYIRHQIRQHLTRSPERRAGVDFREPTEVELDALEAYLLSLGRSEMLKLPLRLRSVAAARGQEIFLDPQKGKCSLCHYNAGDHVDPEFFFDTGGSRNFDTGVARMADTPHDVLAIALPPERSPDGYNTPSLVEAADTGPYFHNNAVRTLEGAVAFYTSDAFDRSPAADTLRTKTGSGIRLAPSQVDEIAAFLRVLNALENIRQSIAYLEKSILLFDTNPNLSRDFVKLSVRQVDDATLVLESSGLAPRAIEVLEDGRRMNRDAIKNHAARSKLARLAILKLDKARNALVAEP